MLPIPFGRKSKQNNKFINENNMILSAHQPAYFPWLGYFDKISKSDVFIYLDDVQFEKNSFINRNKIKTPQGPQWLTIPIKIKGHLNQTIGNTFIDDAQAWRVKHLRSIEMNYSKAPYFKDCFLKLNDLILISESNLSDFCWHHLNFWLEEFQINTKIIKSSELGVESKKSDFVLDICKKQRADLYISGKLGRDYLDEISFSKSGIVIEYQDYNHPVYPQKWGEFEPFMGIIDYWMNCGPGSLPNGKEIKNGI